jgi:error-prone DNA polymerase
MGFIHLHVHSQYSFLDGASTIDALLEKSKQLGMPALALTDHNRLTGAIRFYEKALACGIKPIIGAEIIIEGGYHLTLLCKDREGYSSLCRLITESHLSNKNREPIATRDMLAKNNKGLIALSGCFKGELPTLLREGNIGKLIKAADF